MQLADHEQEFNTLHTRIALGKILTLQNELSKTQNELNATKNTLKNNSQKLLKALFATREELSTTRKKLQQTIDRLNLFEEERKTINIPPKQPPQQIPTQQTTILRLSPQPPQPEQQQAEDNNPISIMTQLLHPTHPHTTQQTYAPKLQHLFNIIQIGEIQHFNNNECFFKLHFPKTYRFLFIYHSNAVKQNSLTIFNNDVIALDDDGSCYLLHLSIKKYDNDNDNDSQCFLIDITKSGGNRLLGYGGGNGNIIDDWEVYRNDKTEVFFYFNKK